MDELHMELEHPALHPLRYTIPALEVKTRRAVGIVELAVTRWNAHQPTLAR